MSKKEKLDLLDGIVQKTVALENFDKRAKDWEQKVKEWGDKNLEDMRKNYKDEKIPKEELDNYNKLFAETKNQKQTKITEDRKKLSSSLEPRTLKLLYSCLK